MKSLMTLAVSLITEVDIFNQWIKYYAHLSCLPICGYSCDLTNFIAGFSKITLPFLILLFFLVVSKIIDWADLLALEEIILSFQIIFWCTTRVLPLLNFIFVLLIIVSSSSKYYLSSLTLSVSICNAFVVPIVEMWELLFIKTNTEKVWWEWSFVPLLILDVREP